MNKLVLLTLLLCPPFIAMEKKSDMDICMLFVKKCEESIKILEERYRKYQQEETRKYIMGYYLSHGPAQEDQDVEDSKPIQLTTIKRNNGCDNIKQLFLDSGVKEEEMEVDDTTDEK